MDCKLISIVIPVYNTEKYLRKCLDSVLKQTYSNLEVICVDDGSTDNSFWVLEDYAHNDKRIKVISQENGGSVLARRKGLEIATGEYVGFVDSDDWIEPTMYERLYNISVRYDADVVTCGCYQEGNYTSMLFDNVPEGYYGKAQMPFMRENMIFNLSEKDVGIRGSLWNKLFKVEKFKEIEGIIPASVSFSEDKLCNLAYMLECDSAYVLREPLYHYVLHSSSLVHKGNTNYLICVNEVYKCFLDLFTHPNFTESMRMQAEIYITDLLIKGINTRLGFRNRNMMWIDPYWLENIPKNAKVLLYGAGELGEAYRNHMMLRPDIEYLGCVDFGYERFASLSEASKLGQVMSPDKLTEFDYDYVVITIKNALKAQEIRAQLQQYASEDKILWFMQEEIYWRYIEAAGLLRDK